MTLSRCAMQAKVSLDRIPDETTLCQFRHYLERKGYTKKLFETTVRYLSERGLMVKGGTIVEATIIDASASTKNQKRGRDRQMGTTKKGNQWHFGMKAHVGTDTQGRVHSVVVTSASKHDSVVMEALLHGEEEAVYGDKAYASAERQAEAEARGVVWRVSRKGGRGRKLTAADQAFNRKSNRTRAKVEHVFGIIKHLWGYRRVRYKGLEKNEAQVFSLMALANLYMVRRELLTRSR